MSDKQLSGSSVIEEPEASIPAPESMINLIEGVVHSQHEGLVHTIVRVRVGRRVDLLVKLARDAARCCIPGQSVMALIPATAVRFEAGLFRRSRQRLNRWYGRIVLLTPLGEGYGITTKLHGEDWILTSTMPILGSSYPPRTWDSVNVVVDLQTIVLLPQERMPRLAPKALARFRQVFQ